MRFGQLVDQCRCTEELYWDFILTCLHTDADGQNRLSWSCSAIHHPIVVGSVDSSAFSEPTVTSGGNCISSGWNATILCCMGEPAIFIGYRYSFNGSVSLVIYKKGMALTIPYSGEPERPRWSNYPFNGGFVSSKYLLTGVKVQSS